MKTLFLFTLTVILSLNLSARENPFAATNAYEEEAARIIELNEINEEETLNAEYIKEMQEKMNNMTSVNKADVNKNKVKEAVNKLTPALKAKPKAKTYSQKEVKKLIKKAQKQTEAKTKAILKKELEKTKIIEPQQVVFVKPRTDIVEDDPMKEKEILPFVKVSYNNNSLTIHTSDKVSKKFALDKDNKIIIDYKAYKNFYTKREDLTSKGFEKIAVGNHKKDRFYRIVVKLTSKPSDYKVNYKDGLITIIKTNEM